MKPDVKICGLVRVEDALLAVDLGARAIGVNLVPASPRCVDVARAKEIAAAVGARAEVVLVVANESLARLTELRRATGVLWLQLHGDETPEDLAGVLPYACKALRIGGAEDVAAADRYGGERILVDAKAKGVLGGSGKTFDWSLVTALATRRTLTLAGGLTPENVAEAARRVRPARVDVASGVELPGKPREKDAARMRALFAALDGP